MVRGPYGHRWPFWPYKYLAEYILWVNNSEHGFLGSPYIPTSDLRRGEQNSKVGNLRNTLFSIPPCLHSILFNLTLLGFHCIAMKAVVQSNLIIIETGLGLDGLQ